MSKILCKILDKASYAQLQVHMQLMQVLQLQQKVPSRRRKAESQEPKSRRMSKSNIQMITSKSSVSLNDLSTDSTPNGKPLITMNH